MSLLISDICFETSESIMENANGHHRYQNIERMDLEVSDYDDSDDDHDYNPKKSSKRKIPDYFNVRYEKVQLLEKRNLTSISEDRENSSQTDITTSRSQPQMHALQLH
ncbi:hypothetical protein JTB14_007015 [Gonioctena quinquepunctata]|nr:hypothetical protein JTB14_007015 [Gonioctena quinquepunctata]